MTFQTGCEDPRDYEEKGRQQGVEEERWLKEERFSEAAIMDELRWSPPSDDPAFEAGYQFVHRHQATGNGFHNGAPWWYGWMVRRAFWCGVKWARERSVPVAGRVVEGGRVEWTEGK